MFVILISIINFKFEKEKSFWGTKEDIPLLHKYGMVGDFIFYMKTPNSKTPIRLAIQSNVRGSDSKTIRRVAIARKFNTEMGLYIYGLRENENSKSNWYKSLSALIDAYKKICQYEDMNPFHKNKSITMPARSQECFIHNNYENDAIENGLDARDSYIEALKKKFQEPKGIIWYSICNM